MAGQEKAGYENNNRQLCVASSRSLLCPSIHQYGVQEQSGQYKAACMLVAQSTCSIQYKTVLPIGRQETLCCDCCFRCDVEQRSDVPIF